MKRSNEKGEGELHTIMVAVILVIMFLAFPGTFYGFVGWVGDKVYAVFDAGESPFHYEHTTPTPAKVPTTKSPAIQPAEPNSNQAPASGLGPEKDNSAKKDS